MKTSVTKIMMSFALMGCLVLSASDAMAQGRSRSQGGSTTSRSQSAAVSRPNKSTAPTVTRASESRSATTPQVNRSTTTNRRSDATTQVNRNTTTNRRSDATPQVNRSADKSSNRDMSGTSSVSRRDDNRSTTIGTSSSSNRSGGASTRPGSSTRGGSGSNTGGKSNSGDAKPLSDMKGKNTTDKGVRHTGSDISSSSSLDKNNRIGGGKPDNGGGKPDNGGGKPGNGGGKPGNGGGKPGNGGGKPDNGGGKPGNGGGKPGNGGHGGGHNGYNPNNRYDYANHHYHNEFSWNHSHHNWSRPLPPPARPYYLSPWSWYRPVIPVGWHPYSGAPIIDRILGLTFGTLYEASLDQLYFDGYFIDGYADGVIYLRDVPMLNLYWPDVMLNYEYNRLANAQFVYHSNYYDTSRFNRVYRSLSRIYGTPVYRDGMTVSWYGGDSRGYVTLSIVNHAGDYYTTMSIGY